METTAILKGIYTPKDYLEKPIHIQAEHLTLEINDGQITVTLRCEIHNPKEEIWDIERQIEQQISNHFRIRRITKCEPFSFHTHEIQLNLADGTTSTRVYGDEATISFTTLADTSEAAIKEAQEEQELAIRATLHAGNDADLQGMLESYIAAANDPDNEISRLYEIKEALKRKFGKKKGYETLGIDETAWTYFEDLANTNIRQGRHRGRYYKQLRNVTDEEREQAKAIARLLINRYIDHLQSRR